MIWYLLFSHFLADYPLQPTWIVKNKNRTWVLIIHGLIHLATLSVVVGGALRQIYPYLLLLTVFHFLVDFSKNLVNKWKPEWVIGPYLIDQTIHYISIWILGTWIERVYVNLDLPLDARWLVYATGYLVVTYVWFISERILAYSDEAYRKEVDNYYLARMMTRGGLLSLFLLGWSLINDSLTRIGAGLALPYLSGSFGYRALLTDLIVAITGIIFIQLAL